MVFQTLETDFAVRQRSNDLHQTSSRYGALPFDLHLGKATRPRGQFKVASGDLQPRAGSLHEKMGKDGNGALLLDRTLDQIEFVQELRLLCDEFHGGDLTMHFVPIGVPGLCRFASTSLD